MHSGRLEKFLPIASRTQALGQKILDAVNAKVMQPSQEVTTVRQQVLFGLGLKAFRCFEDLLFLAQQRRGNAMILLKTLTETWIFMHFAVKDQGELNAKYVYATSCNQKVVFFENNKDYSDQAKQVAAWKTKKKALCPTYNKRTLKDLAEDQDMTHMEAWYRRVYRLACEPAHIGDLINYIPQPGQAVEWADSQMAPLSATIALNYGMLIILHIFKDTSATLALGFEEEIGELENEVAEQRASS